MGPWSLAVHAGMERGMDTEEGLGAGVSARQDGKGRVEVVVGRVVVDVLAIEPRPARRRGPRNLPMIYP